MNKAAQQTKGNMSGSWFAIYNGAPLLNGDKIMDQTFISFSVQRNEVTVKRADGTYYTDRPERFEVSFQWEDE